MRASFCVFLAALLPTPLLAHPGSGIVVDRFGQVYFIDTGSGLWKITTSGELVRIQAPRFHWLALDAADRFATARLPSGPAGEITPVGSGPTLLLASDYPLAIGRDGNLYYPSRRTSSAVDLLRVLPSGERSVLAGISLPFLNGLAAAHDGSLYFTENRAIRRISPQGTVSTVAEQITLPSCPRIPGMDANDPQLRGLAVDSSGTVYVAASGCGSLLKVTPDGRFTSLLQLESPWSPTAVALSGSGDLYVLEYLHTEVEDRLLWLPRVRKLSRDGQNTIIATVSR